jgi:hypothetical protein
VVSSLWHARCHESHPGTEHKSSRDGLRHRRCRPWPRAPREAGTQIYLTLPVANTEGERSFSVLKRIKNTLRSNTGQDKVSDLSILSIESPITRNLNCDQITEGFARNKARKKAM